MTSHRKPLRVGIVGLGAIGSFVARKMAEDPNFHLAAVCDQDPGRAGGTLAALGIAAPVLGVEALVGEADVIVECASARSFRAIAEPAIEAGRIFVPLSVGAILDHESVLDRARETGARIVVPTGAIAGLDAVRAAAVGRIESVTLRTTKHPKGLEGAPHVVSQGIRLEDIREPTRIFQGSAREGAKGFPANVNVAVALSLAGIGPDRTRLEVWADPAATRNVHRITVVSDSADLSFETAALPFEEKPKPRKLAAFSAIAALRSITAPIRVGS